MSVRKVRRSLGLCLILLSIGGTLGVPSEAGAGATAFGVDYYISPPLVQGSYVTASTGGVLEDFNRPTGTCPTTLNGGISVSGAAGPPTFCLIWGVADYGGALVSTEIPTVSGTPTNFATTVKGNDSMTFTMETPQRYLGFWWSAGSPGNTVTFYSGTTELLELTTDAILTALGAAPSDGTYGSTDPIEALNGTEYTAHHYFGNPRGYTSTSPNQAEWDAMTLTNKDQPFVYFHVFSRGGMTFDRVVFSGINFEFDNFVVSPDAQRTSRDLVFLGSEGGTPPPDFVPPGSGGWPSIDLDHYANASELPNTELPNTGRSRSGLEWIAVALFVSGAVLIGAQRHLRRT